MGGHIFNIIFIIQELVKVVVIIFKKDDILAEGMPQAIKFILKPEFQLTCIHIGPEGCANFFLRERMGSSQKVKE